MPDNFTLYLMLVAALAIGYLLGRRERKRGAAPERNAEQYFNALHPLITDHREFDTDQFVEALMAGEHGVDTRLALGALVRRRGEVDKAIRIHQGLLARPDLTPAQRSQTELALARDYMAAGLLGRAENLLLELTRRNGPERPTAQRALLEIYQREREWQRAVEVGREIARQDRSVNAKLAHFQCELAEQALALHDLRLARQALARGADFDSGCARVSLIGARVELEAGRPRDARRLLRRAVTQDPDRIPLAVAPYRDACQVMDDQAGFATFLEGCLQHGAYLPVVEAMAEHLNGSTGAAAAADFVMEQLLRNPNLGGFVTLLEHFRKDDRPLTAEHLDMVRRFSSSLLARQPVHRCRNCGFSSRTLMWQCPSCHEWGVCKPIETIKPR
jgi:lipopolysaccharide biosynthesis regulator YciM